MIRLASLIEQFGKAFIQQYSDRLLPSHLKAIERMKQCRSSYSPKMLVQCQACEHQEFIPHSCGHRNCPQCQHYESQQWIEKQLKKQLPVTYFMLTFTLPAEFRSLAWQHQRLIYGLLFDCVWQTVKRFTKQDKKLGGMPGATAVLHTHSRALDFHPHVHLLIPAASVDMKKREWRKKEEKYLFNHKALATMFRAKFLHALVQQGFTLPVCYPKKWVVNCRQMGGGKNALIYLGKYLYRGVISENNILSCHQGLVTFQYQDSETKKMKRRTVSGVHFLWLVFQHILPRGFRRARDYGFLHPNSHKLRLLLFYLLKFDPLRWIPVKAPRPQKSCRCCGGDMVIVQTNIRASDLVIQLCPT